MLAAGAVSEGPRDRLGAAGGVQRAPGPEKLTPDFDFLAGAGSGI